jgi:hypothetical protein
MARNVIHLTALAAVRSGLAFSTTLEANPNLIGDHLEAANNVTTVLNFAGDLVLAKKDDCIAAVIWCFNMFQSVLGTMFPGPHTVKPDLQIEVIQSTTETPSTGVTTRATPTAEEQEAEETLMLQMLNYTHLERIPTAYDSDERFFYKCRISRHSIRFIVIPNTIENNPVNTPCYEKIELEKWVRETPHVAPEAWPIDKLPLPLQSECFKVCAIRQQVIDTTLKNIAGGIRANMKTRRSLQNPLGNHQRR